MVIDSLAGGSELSILERSRNMSWFRFTNLLSATKTPVVRVSGASANKHLLYVDSVAL